MHGHREDIPVVDEFGAYDYLAPGRLPVMEEDCEMVEFAPKEISRKMMELAGRNMASM